MRTDLALKNILHNLPKTTIALAGIGVAIVLIFMQLGFRGAVENTATAIYERMDFDLIVRSPNYLHFVEPGRLPLEICSEVQSFPEVGHLIPFHVTLAGWLGPDGKNLRGIMVMGVDADNPPFVSQDIVAELSQLKTDGDVLIDTTTNREFGPLNGLAFTEQDVGRRAELSRTGVRIAGLFELGAGLTANGSVMINEDGFRKISWQNDAQSVSFALLKLTPNVDVSKFRQQLEDRLRTADGHARANVLTRQMVIQNELRRWVGETPIGFVFTLGVLISLIVGGAIFYMVLSTDVTNRIVEFATLKAMGYSNGQLSMIVMGQAIYLGLLAFFPSFLLALACYQLTESLANLPIEMNWRRAFAVFFLTQLMCISSGLLALRKLYGAEPAALF